MKVVVVGAGIGGMKSVRMPAASSLISGWERHSLPSPPSRRGLS
jgi:hypothetical protein